MKKLKKILTGMALAGTAFFSHAEAKQAPSGNTSPLKSEMASRQSLRVSNTMLKAPEKDGLFFLIDGKGSDGFPKRLRVPFSSLLTPDEETLMGYALQYSASSPLGFENLEAAVKKNVDYTMNSFFTNGTTSAATFIPFFNTISLNPDMHDWSKTSREDQENLVCSASSYLDHENDHAFSQDLAPRFKNAAQNQFFMQLYEAAARVKQLAVAFAEADAGNPLKLNSYKFRMMFEIETFDNSRHAGDSMPETLAKTFITTLHLSHDVVNYQKSRQMSASNSLFGFTELGPEHLAMVTRLLPAQKDGTNLDSYGALINWTLLQENSRGNSIIPEQQLAEKRRRRSGGPMNMGTATPGALQKARTYNYELGGKYNFLVQSPATREYQPFVIDEDKVKQDILNAIAQGEKAAKEIRERKTGRNT
ncbi:MAG: hypothetical protein LBU87_02540 [Lactobacillales bacterium]|jgi:hypothetical protein|nr:hypothetical protein [Lactobacillales bacterium]